MLAHAGGAATIDAPVWLLAYGAAAVVLLTTVTLRGRMLVAGADGGGGGGGARGARAAGGGPGDEDAGGVRGPGVGASDRRDGRRGAGRGGGGGTVVDRGLAHGMGHAVGVALLAVVVTAALFGPAASAANVAPSAVLSLWWVGLPLTCLLAGDVMAWLDPFGTLARPLARRGPERPAPAWTAAALLATWAWWVLAYHDGRSPRALGSFVVLYTLAAVGGAVVWGRPWLRRGEAFGALSSTLARVRTPAPHPAPVTDGRRAAMTAGTVTATVAAALVAVWLGATAFDLFTGTRAWVDLAAGSSGWVRTGRATGCLAAAIGLAGLVVTGTARLAAWAASGTGSRVPSVTTTGRRAASAVSGTGRLAVPAATDPSHLTVPTPPDTNRLGPPTGTSSTATSSTATSSNLPAAPTGTDTDRPGPPAAADASHLAPRSATTSPGRRASGTARCLDRAPDRVREAVVLAWSAATAGVFVGHGLPVLLLDGQFALSLASDPLGRGWDLFGTARRTIDYSPLSPGLVGAAQLAAVAGGAAWGVVVAARVLRSGRDSRGPGAPAAVRALWVVGVVLAGAAAAGAAVLSADLE